jgi:subtilase family serine protease
LGAALNGISCAHQLPTFPAESPWVLAVGGEQWDGGGSAANPVLFLALPSFRAHERKLGQRSPRFLFTPSKYTIPQQVYWYAGGAGFSKRFKMPSYQKAAVTAYLTQHPTALPPATSFDAAMRAYPDVVALAWGVPMVANGSTVVTGGTSASAPVTIPLASDTHLMKSRTTHTNPLLTPP